MKKINWNAGELRTFNRIWWRLLLFGWILVFTVISLPLTVCGQNKHAPVKANVFDDVTDKLDKGGIYFSYQGTEEIYRKYNKAFESIEKLALNLAGKGKFKSAIKKVSAGIRKSITLSGLSDIRVRFLLNI